MTIYYYSRVTGWGDVGAEYRSVNPRWSSSPVLTTPFSHPAPETAIGFNTFSIENMLSYWSRHTYPDFPKYENQGKSSSPMHCLHRLFEFLSLPSISRNKLFIAISIHFYFHFHCVCYSTFDITHRYTLSYTFNYLPTQLGDPPRA